MAISQISQTVVLRGLALTGFRSDVATLVSVKDGCGHTSKLAIGRLAKTSVTSRHIPLCKASLEESVTISATAPSGQPVSLFVNGTEVATRATAAPIIVFEHVVLRPGSNIVAVGVGSRARSAFQFGNPGQVSHMTSFGWLPVMYIGEPLALDISQDYHPPSLVGGLDTPWGPRLLFEGQERSGQRDEKLGVDVQTDDDGFAIVPVTTMPSGIRLLKASNFARTVAITRLPDGDVRAEAQACLPRGSILAVWAASGTLSANDFITRVANIRFDRSYDQSANVDEGLNTIETPSCRQVRAFLITPRDALRRDGGNFLSSPFDTFRVVNFGQRLRLSEAPTETAAKDTLIFKGSAIDPRKTLNIEPNFGVLRAEQNRVKEDRKSQGTTPSRLGAAWSRAHADLPYWLQALLSGVAAVIPIGLLIFVITRMREHDHGAVAARVSSLAGLYALLVLALAAAAQPLLFQLFYQASRVTGIWDAMGESRGDGGPSVIDPYAPIALAVAVMLVSLVNVSRRPEERQSAALTTVLALGSIGAVVTLILAMLYQVLPWQTSYRVEERGWLLRWLTSLDPSADQIVWLTLAVLAFATVTAWIPLYWGFRSLMRRPGLLGSSVIAGVAATLLPLFGYGVEAARIAFGTPMRDYSDSDPSWLSLAGSALLPFVLYLVLLRGFKEIAVTVTADKRSAMIKRVCRTSSLAIAALVLTIPRLTLEQVNPSPSSMNVIDILEIFQSFGLVLAVVAAAELLRAYAPVATAQEKLRPFVLQADEIALLAALFAGFLSLWAREPLATVAAIAVGWVIFNRLAIDPNTTLPPELATESSTAQLIAYHQEVALLDARRKSIEGRYAKGEDQFSDLDAARQEMDKIKSEHEAALGVQPGEAKRRLLEFGPEQTPLRNGALGAAAGMLFASILQLASAFPGLSIDGPLSGWADLARHAIADPSYAISPTSSGRGAATVDALRDRSAPDLLFFIGTVINAYFFWTVLGFLFGFVFHRIRGDDGVVKALVFALAVSATFAVSQLFSVGSTGLDFGRTLPIFLFMLLLGVVVFDARSLMTRKQNPMRLADVYGLKTSIGYASLIGGLAAFEPLLKFVRDLFGK